MALLAYADYQTLTADTATAEGDFDDALADVVAELEDELDRSLESGERTERCRIYTEPRGQVVYPACTPISTATGYTIAGRALIGASPISSPGFLAEDPDYASVTYTGGYTSATLPRSLRNAIAWAIYSDTHPDASVPNGATSARVGDAAVTYARSTVTGERYWPRTVTRHRFRPVALGHR